MGNCLFCEGRPHSDEDASGGAAASGPGATPPSIAFVDFGVCGSLPPFLRGALLLQALSFVLEDTQYFSEGFAYALRTMPAKTEAPRGGQPTAALGGGVATEAAAATGGRTATAATAGEGGFDGARKSLPPPKETAAAATVPAAPDAGAAVATGAAALGAHAAPEAPCSAELDTAALTADLAPLFAELSAINPLRASNLSGEVDPAIYGLLVRGQLLLHTHGVQLPKEFALLIKTMLFGADYLTLFRGEEMKLLSRQLTRAATAYVATNAREIASVVPPSALARVGATAATTAAKSSLRSARSALAVHGRWQKVRELVVWATALSPLRRLPGADVTKPSSAASARLAVPQLALLVLLVALLVGLALPMVGGAASSLTASSTGAWLRPQVSIPNAST